MIASLLLLASMTAADLQALPPPPPPAPQGARDPGRRLPEPKGTAVVRGRVVGGDSGQPVRRIVVALNQSGAPNRDAPASDNSRMVSKSTTTDDQGRFEFKDLPAGYYRLSANPSSFQAQYLRGGYGQKRLDDPGVPFELSDGQVLASANITLPRAGVITGRITDEEGEPLARVGTYVLMFPPGSSTPSRSGQQVETNDLGQFRIYGLQAGEYLVAAQSRRDGPVSDQEPSGFLPTYYPGVPTEAEGQRVRVRPGGETTSVDFRLIRGRFFKVSGTVMDSQGRALPRVNGNLARAVMGSSNLNFSDGFSTDENGRFRLQAVAPGDYKFVVRPRLQPMLPPGVTPPSSQQPEQLEYAITDVRVDADLDDVVITTRPGATITGRIVYADPPPPPAAGERPPQTRVLVTPPPGGGAIGFGAPPALVAPDLTFSLRGVAGPVVLRATNLPRNFIVRQVIAGGEDITDRPHEFTGRDATDVQVVVSSRVAGIEGSVTDERGQPVLDCVVVLMPDSAEMRRGAIGLGFTRSASPDPRGHFRLPMLRPGRYLIVAVTRDRLPRTPADWDVIEGVAKDAQPVVLDDGEFKVFDLKLAGGG